MQITNNWNPKKMDTSKLKKFAQHARRTLMEQMSNKLDMVLDSESAARRESSRAVVEVIGGLYQLYYSGKSDRVNS